MVTCAVCETEYAETRAECPCCGRKNPHPPAAAAAPPPRLPPAPLVQEAKPSPPFEQSGPLPRAFSPPVRPPGPTGPVPPPPSPILQPPPAALPPTPPEPEPAAQLSPAPLPPVAIPPPEPPRQIPPLDLPPVRQLVVPPVAPLVVSPVVQPVVPVARPRPAPLPPVEVLENIRTEDLLDNPVRPTPRAWRVRLRTPDASPAALPPLLTAARPWEEGFEVELEISEERGGQLEPLREGWLKWRIRSTEEDGSTPGRVLESEQPDHGDWTTDELGRVRFRFAPSRENALLFARRGPTCWVQFDVFLPDETGQPGQPLPPGDRPDELGQASFHLAWAPKFDLGVFKLPFFIAADAPLDLAAEPDAETARPIVWGLGGSEAEYRQLFRDGGVLTLSLQVADPGDASIEPFRQVVEHARIVVGAAGQAPGEERQVVEFAALGEAVTGGVAVSVAASPASREPARTVALNADLPIHPAVRRELWRVVEACRELEQELALCPTLDPPPNFSADGRARFQELAGQFFAEAAGVLCAARQTTLVAKRQAFRETLGAMRGFLAATTTVWKRLGQSVELHRSAFRRLETVLLNFYRDFLLWGLVHDKLAAGWKALRAAVPTLPAEMRWNAAPESLLAVVHSAQVKSGLETVAKPLLERWRAHWQEQLEPLTTAASQCAETGAKAGAALEAAELQVQEAVALAERQIDDLSALLARQAVSAAPTPGLGARRVALGRALLTQLGEIREASLRRERRARASVLTEAQARATEVDGAVMAQAGQRLEEGLRQCEQVLTAAQADVERWTTLLDQARPIPPENEISVQYGEVLAQLRVQQAKRQESATGLASKLGRLRERWRPLLEPEAALSGALEQEFAALLTSLEEEGQRTQTILDEAIALWPGRVAASAAVRKAEEEVRAGMLAEAMAEASRPGVALLQTAEVEPPAAPTGLDGLLVRQLGEFVQACLRGGVGLVPRAAGQAGRVVGGLARYLIVFPLSLLLRLTARFGARIVEAVTALFESTLNLRGGMWTSSALTPPVLNAGLAELRKLSGSPEKFFAFPFVKERVVLSHLAETADNLRQNQQLPDRASEQFVEEALRSGYDYYYPNQLKQARLLLLGLCRRALSRETLSLAPGSRESAARSAVCLAAAEALERGIAEVDARAGRADGASEGFKAPLAEVVGGERWSTATLSDTASWCGWVMAWTFRLARLVLALAAWWLPSVQTLAAALIHAANPAGGVAAMVRRLFEIAGYYPYSAAYPRDLLAQHAAHCAVLFGTESERLPTQSTADFVKGYPN